MAAIQAKLGILDHFSALQDPRQAWKVVYPLPEIMLLILAATMASAEDFVEIEEWGEEQLDFLRTLLPYANGIPSHDAQMISSTRSIPSCSRRASRLGWTRFAMSIRRSSPSTARPRGAQTRVNVIYDR